MPLAYYQIASTTLSNTSNNVSFASIPSNYTDLVLVLSLKQSAASGSNPYFYFNNTTGVTCSTTLMYGNGSTTGGTRFSSASTFPLFWWTNLTDTSFAFQSTVHINGYSNTTTYKPVIARSSDATKGTETTANQWQSTSAISQINIAIGSNAFAIGSTFSLYGIKAA